MEHDRQSRDNSIKVQYPALVLWGAKGKIEKWYKPMDIWKLYCANTLQGGAIDSGHTLAEEAPDVVIDEFLSFFK